MTDLLKAGFLAAWTEFHTHRKTILTPEQVLEMLTSAELDLYYSYAKERFS